ncbi:MAG: hypothetical protein A2756_04040 [Candidatus Ryanbacteria bacterium RIFCSPHIGHO2_01_FULL_48_27]|uniref:Uncharacterized protein n=1 Tax=Candidatus Ryanbacteria bacterium RIFCSPHIGHO2_01_FULL_48_27 TaxID=1802115 RepID=A0A1G2G3M0_9BACT|nr:MAG: hypothetical protein A2756_04040 [Candidatus Ryanbacteria bacterium RIFCSPHIGHO2_01_FULL_48_27]
MKKIFLFVLVSFVAGLISGMVLQARSDLWSIYSDRTVKTPPEGPKGAFGLDPSLIKREDPQVLSLKGGVSSLEMDSFVVAGEEDKRPFTVNLSTGTIYQRTKILQRKDGEFPLGGGGLFTVVSAQRRDIQAGDFVEVFFSEDIRNKESAVADLVVIQ